MEFTPNFQNLRHSRIAALFRWFAYSGLIGDEEWPPTFRAPLDLKLRTAPSRNVYVHLPFCETICPHCPTKGTLRSCAG